MFFKKTYTAKCGHKTKLKGKLTAFGESCDCEMNILEGEKTPEYCFDCLSEMTIKCGWCKKNIFIGDIITLYSPSKDEKWQEMKNDPEVIVYNEEHKQVVGCGRTTCADTGMDYAGSWVPPGEVYRRPSGVELLMANPDAKMVFNLNADNPNSENQLIK